jgi:hypothetical protein
VAHKSDEPSNMTHIARKQRVDHHQIIHAEQSSSFEPILRQNYCDGDKVRFDEAKLL